MADQSPKSLEQEAAYHRDSLASAIAGLINNRAPERMGHAAAEEASALAQSVIHKGAEAVKSNPAGLALIACGVATLAMSKAPARDTRSKADRIAKAHDRMQQKARVEANRFDTRPGQAAALRKALDRGLDALGPDAREKVKAARLKAIDAQERVERQAAKAKAQAAAQFQKDPLVSGLLVAGIGALIGAALPSTRIEREQLGATRDALFRDAEAVLRQELARVKAKGTTALDAGVAEARAQFKDEVSDPSLRH